mgnify:CR=1 FL=1
MAGAPIAGRAPRGVETAALTLLAMIAFAAYEREAGLPDGVFNVLHGDKTAVDGISFDVRAGEVLFRQGEPSTGLYAVVHGRIALTARSSPTKRASTRPSGRLRT